QVTESSKADKSTPIPDTSRHRVCLTALAAAYLPQIFPFSPVSGAHAGEQLTVLPAKSASKPGPGPSLRLRSGPSTSLGPTPAMPHPDSRPLARVFRHLEIAGKLELSLPTLP
ncbi:hypothetical protein CCUS01_11030, partial [Colletotrichum cuscutae]